MLLRYFGAANALGFLGVGPDVAEPAITMRSLWRCGGSASMGRRFLDRLMIRTAFVERCVYLLIGIVVAWISRLYHNFWVTVRIRDSNSMDFQR